MSLSLLLSSSIPDLSLDPATGKLTGAAAAKAAEKAAAAAARRAAKEAAKLGAKVAEETMQKTAEIVQDAATPPPSSSPSIPSPPSFLSEFISSLDPTTTAIVVGAIIILIFIIYRKKFSQTGQTGNTFILAGVMGVGKTALYYQLKQGLFRQTVTSSKPNEEEFVVKQLEGKVSSYRYVDLPGHASQRVKMESIKPVTKAVIFIVDGSANETLASSAQYLYTLLIDPIFTARRTPFFIAVNKTDLFLNKKEEKKNTALIEEDEEEETEDGPAKSEDVLQTISSRLEKLLDTSRSLQSTMADLEEGETKTRTLGVVGKTFCYSDSVCPITVGGISALKGDLTPLLEFIQQN